MVPRPLQLQGQQQQQQQANGQEHKRKQGDGSPGSKLAAAQQQPAAKQQRLERPGKLVGATAAMVVGMQVCLCKGGGLGVLFASRGGGL